MFDYAKYGQQIIALQHARDYAELLEIYTDLVADVLAADVEAHLIVQLLRICKVFFDDTDSRLVENLE